jgi:hypothetical protein
VSTIKEIEAAIKKLSPLEVARVTNWLVEYDAKLWDKEMDEDAEAGWLDFLFKEADAEYKSRKLRNWPRPQK